MACTSCTLTWSLEWPYMNYHDHARNTQAFARNIPDLARIIQDLLWIIQDITWISQDLPWIIQDIAWIFQDHAWSCQELFQNPSWTIQDHCQDHAGRGATQSDNSTPLHTNIPITTQPLPVLTLLNHFNTFMNNLQMTYCRRMRWILRFQWEYNGENQLR